MSGSKSDDTPPEQPRKLTIAELEDLIHRRGPTADVTDKAGVSAKVSGSDNQKGAAQITPDRRSGEALYQELRAAIRPRGSRRRLTIPQLPSPADYEFAKLKANRDRSVMRHATPDAKAAIAQERWGRQFLARVHPTKRPRREHDGYLRIASYLAALSWRIMNDRHLAGRNQPTREELGHALRLYVARHLSKFLRGSDPTTKATRYERHAFVTAEKADDLAESLAASMLRDWGPAWIEERQRRGRAGGRAGKPRGRKWTGVDLDRLAALPDLTREQQAQALGFSVATVKRMRTELRVQQQERD